MSEALQPVNCNNCGAPLEVAAGTNFVTCGHCGSRLAVKRTGSSAFTEVLGAIEQNTATMTRQLAEIAYRAELERIDREWEAERRTFLTTDENGNPTPPIDKATQFVGAIVGIGFGVFWTAGATWMAVMANSDNGPGGGMGLFFGCFPLFGFVFIGLGVWSALTGAGKADRYEAAQAAYRERRAAVTVEQFQSPGSAPAG